MTILKNLWSESSLNHRMQHCNFRRLFEFSAELLEFRLELLEFRAKLFEFRDELNNLIDTSDREQRHYEVQDIQVYLYRVTLINIIPNRI